MSTFIKSKLLFLLMILFFGKNTNAENADTLFKRAQCFEKTNVDSAKIYYSKIRGAEYLSEKMPDVYAKSLRRFAVLNAEITDDNLNVVFCNQAISIFKKINNFKEVGITYNSLANIYQVKGFFDLSISNYQKAAAIFDSIQFYKGLTICYSNIASIYNNTEQFKNALHYNLLALQTASRMQDTFSIGMIANDVSIAFTKNNAIDSAKKYASLALKNGQLIKNDFVISYAYKAQFEFNKAQQKWNDAYTNAMLALASILKTKSEYDACLAYCNVAESAVNTDRNSEAEISIIQAESIAKKINSFQLFKRVYSLHKVISSAKGDYKQAFEYAQLYQQYSDSVFFEKRNNTLNELETKYQTAQKEAKIATQKIEIQQQEIKAKQAKIRFIIAVVLILILLLSAVALYVFLKQRQKLLQNKIINIEQQKKLELTQAIIDGEEMERVRLAKELHDGIGGLMSMIKLQFTNFKKSHTEIQENPEYNDALSLLNTASQDIRKISHALMPSALERLGLIDATEQFCTQMQQSANIEIDFQHYHLEDRLPQKMELLVYRMIQELLNNIIKYANAKEVLVQLSKNEKNISLTVEDDGIGFDISTIKNKDGIGLLSMQNRIHLLGGKMDIDTAIGKGTSIHVELPVS
ncbi:MAG TPA: sensor histidine kinase [Chitinophagales bacterium]|nr:sensor histidine kinase [Chitinophagales bacterium]